LPPFFSQDALPVLPVYHISTVRVKEISSFFAIYTRECQNSRFVPPPGGRGAVGGGPAEGLVPLDSLSSPAGGTRGGLLAYVRGASIVYKYLQKSTNFKTLQHNLNFF